MNPHQLTINKLIREAEAARLEEAVLAATGEEILDRTQQVAQAVQEKVRQVARQDQPHSPGRLQVDGPAGSGAGAALVTEPQAQLPHEMEFCPRES